MACGWVWLWALESALLLLDCWLLRELVQELVCGLEFWKVVEWRRQLVLQKAQRLEWKWETWLAAVYRHLQQ